MLELGPHTNKGDVPVIGSWSDVELLLRERPPGTLLRIPKGWLPHPKARGFKSSPLLPSGQVASYRRALGERSDLLVCAFARGYVVWIQPTNRKKTPRSRDGVVALGALLGTMLGRSEQSIVTAAALTGFFFRQN